MNKNLFTQQSFFCAVFVALVLPGYIYAEDFPANGNVCQYCDTFPIGNNSRITVSKSTKTESELQKQADLAASKIIWKKPKKNTGTNIPKPTENNTKAVTLLPIDIVFSEYASSGGGSAPDVLGDIAYRSQQFSVALARVMSTGYDLAQISKGILSEQRPTTLAQVDIYLSRINKGMHWYEKRSNELKVQTDLLYYTIDSSKFSQAEKLAIKARVKFLLLDATETSALKKPLSGPVYALRNFYNDIKTKNNILIYKNSTYNFSGTEHIAKTKELDMQFQGWIQDKDATLSKLDTKYRLQIPRTLAIFHRYLD